MLQVNHHYLKLQAGYLFPEIARRVKAFADAHPEAPRTASSAAASAT